ncbi:helix-turn-helix transcriptional regulator [Micrococcus endophyticus]|uniref:helix-turn-helix transcriptional regulator n=1 Tax=Micrococcus endophyticus TaxID=455343 RepID=UPI003811515B
MTTTPTTPAPADNYAAQASPAALGVRPLWSPADVAAFAGVPVKTVYTWRTTGTGPRGFRVGKHVRYRAEDVEAWVAEQIEKDDAEDAR